MIRGKRIISCIGVTLILSLLQSVYMLSSMAAEPSAPLIYKEGQLSLKDGTTIAYYIRPGDGPNLVLVPGSWGDYRVFDDTCQALDKRLNIIIIEMRGHGRSQPATLNGSIELFADDVLQVTKDLKLNEFYVGGHSIGGMIAVELAGRKYANLTGSISIEGWTHHKVAKEAFSMVISNTLNEEQEALRMARRTRVLNTLTKEERAHFASLWRIWDGLPILESTKVPVLELWGDRNLNPKPSHSVMRIPERSNIELVWMEGASHSLLIECPVEVAIQINAFITKIESAEQPKSNN